ncbi:MAG: hypothetical protein ACRENU_05840 [Gemmatimonadaceae bacterium]
MSRAIDLASLTLLVVGAALYLRAYFGMESVRTTPETPFVPGTMEAFALLNQFVRLKRLSYVGLSLVGLGLAVGLSAALHARKISRRAQGQNPIPE